MSKSIGKMQLFQADFGVGDSWEKNFYKKNKKNVNKILIYQKQYYPWFKERDNKPIIYKFLLIKVYCHRCSSLFFSPFKLNQLCNEFLPFYYLAYFIFQVSARPTPVL